MAINVAGQNAPLNEEEWEKLTDGKSYTEEVEQPRSPLNLPHFDFGLSAEVLKYFVFFLVLGLLVFFVVRYLINLQNNAVLPEEIKIDVATLREAEENPMQADLAKLIERLIEEGKFREATRAYFLYTLQRLHRHNFINWQKQKTNFDYVGEVNQEAFHSSFNKLTAYFEMTWYGRNSLNEVEFKRIEPEFKSLVNTIDDARKK